MRSAKTVQSSKKASKAAISLKSEATSAVPKEEKKIVIHESEYAEPHFPASIDHWGVLLQEAMWMSCDIHNEHRWRCYSASMCARQAAAVRKVAVPPSKRAPVVVKKEREERRTEERREGRDRRERADRSEREDKEDRREREKDRKEKATAESSTTNRDSVSSCDEEEIFRESDLIEGINSTGENEGEYQKLTANDAITLHNFLIIPIASASNSSSPTSTRKRKSAAANFQAANQAASSGSSMTQNLMENMMASVRNTWFAEAPSYRQAALQSVHQFLNRLSITTVQDISSVIDSPLVSPAIVRPQYDDDINSIQNISLIHGLCSQPWPGLVEELALGLVAFTSGNRNKGWKSLMQNGSVNSPSIAGVIQSLPYNMNSQNLMNQAVSGISQNIFLNRPTENLIQYNNRVLRESHQKNWLSKIGIVYANNSLYSNLSSSLQHQIFTANNYFATLLHQQMHGSGISNISSVPALKRPLDETPANNQSSSTTLSSLFKTKKFKDYVSANSANTVSSSASDTKTLSYEENLINSNQNKNLGVATHCFSSSKTPHWIYQSCINLCAHYAMHHNLDTVGIREVVFANSLLSSQNLAYQNFAQSFFYVPGVTNIVLLLRKSVQESCDRNIQSIDTIRKSLFRQLILAGRCWNVFSPYLSPRILSFQETDVLSLFIKSLEHFLYEPDHILTDMAVRGFIDRLSFWIQKHEETSTALVEAGKDKIYQFKTWSNFTPWKRWSASSVGGKYDSTQLIRSTHSASNLSTLISHFYDKVQQHEIAVQCASRKNAWSERNISNNRKNILKSRRQEPCIITEDEDNSSIVNLEDDTKNYMQDEEDMEEVKEDIAKEDREEKGRVKEELFKVQDEEDAVNILLNSSPLYLRKNKNVNSFLQQCATSHIGPSASSSLNNTIVEDMSSNNSPFFLKSTPLWTKNIGKVGKKLNNKSFVMDAIRNTDPHFFSSYRKNLVATSPQSLVEEIDLTTPSISSIRTPQSAMTLEREAKVPTKNFLPVSFGESKKDTRSLSNMLFADNKNARCQLNEQIYNPGGASLALMKSIYNPPLNYAPSNSMVAYHAFASKIRSKNLPYSSRNQSVIKCKNCLHRIRSIPFPSGSEPGSVSEGASNIIVKEELEGEGVIFGEPRKKRIRTTSVSIGDGSLSPLPLSLSFSLSLSHATGQSTNGANYQQFSPCADCINLANSYVSHDSLNESRGVSKRDSPMTVPYVLTNVRVLTSKFSDSEHKKLMQFNIQDYLENANQDRSSTELATRELIQFLVEMLSRQVLHSIRRLTSASANGSNNSAENEIAQNASSPNNAPAATLGGDIGEIIKKERLKEASMLYGSSNNSSNLDKYATIRGNRRLYRYLSRHSLCSSLSVSPLPATPPVISSSNTSHQNFSNTLQQLSCRTDAIQLIVNDVLLPLPLSLLIHLSKQLFKDTARIVTLHGGAPNNPSVNPASQSNPSSLLSNTSIPILHSRWMYIIKTTHCSFSFAPYIKISSPVSFGIDIERLHQISFHQNFKNIAKPECSVKNLFSCNILFNVQPPKPPTAAHPPPNPSTSFPPPNTTPASNTGPSANNPQAIKAKAPSGPPGPSLPPASSPTGFGKSGLYGVNPPAPSSNTTGALNNPPGQPPNPSSANPPNANPSNSIAYNLMQNANKTAFPYPSSGGPTTGGTNPSLVNPPHGSSSMASSRMRTTAGATNTGQVNANPLHSTSPQTHHRGTTNFMPSHQGNFTSNFHNKSMPVTMPPASAPAPSPQSASLNNPPGAGASTRPSPSLMLSNPNNMVSFSAKNPAPPNMLGTNQVNPSGGGMTSNVPSTSVPPSTGGNPPFYNSYPSYYTNPTAQSTGNANPSYHPSPYPSNPLPTYASTNPVATSGNVPPGNMYGAPNYTANTTAPTMPYHQGFSNFHPFHMGNVPPGGSANQQPQNNPNQTTNQFHQKFY